MMIIFDEFEERKAWLSSLKEGDTVYDIIYDYSYISAVKQYKIKKITTTGKIRLDDDTLLDNNGYRYNSSWGGSSVKILPMCDKVEKAINEIKTKNLYKECKNLLEQLPAKDLNYESLLKIKEILIEMKPK